MAYLIQKRGKFMTGHGYATGVGYSYSWSTNEAEARRFGDDDAMVDVHAQRTKGKPVYRPNTRQELRQLGRERISIRSTQKQDVHPSDAKINRRARAA